MSIEKSPFGKTKDGKETLLFTLTNASGATAKITNFGGIVTSLIVPDKAGKWEDVVLGFDTLDGYLAGHPYFGALIGRYGNRIAKAVFTLNGKEYPLAANDGRNHLHGGLVGFDKVVWDASDLKKSGGAGVRLTYLSKDGEEGYPGNLACAVEYFLSDQNELSIDYSATTDRATVVNLTHHGYFNLKGAGNGDVLDHEIQIMAQKVMLSDKELIPTGELKPVAGTPWDFTQPRKIGARIGEVDGGYDHNFILADKPRALTLAAVVTAPGNGRKMEVLTTEPGIQFYSGNFLDGTLAGKGGKKYGKHSGFCLEAQHYPDSPNRPAYPTTVLNPGETYRQQTVYRFIA